MKSLEELETLLFSRIRLNIENIGSQDLHSIDQFAVFNNTSHIIAAVLGQHLKLIEDLWKEVRWQDDCLMREVQHSGEFLTLTGVAIWGIFDSTEQWVDPFSFHVEVEKEKYTLLFADLEKSSITYHEYKSNADYWDWNKMDWGYIFHESNRSLE